LLPKSGVVVSVCSYLPGEYPLPVETTQMIDTSCRNANYDEHPDDADNRSQETDKRHPPTAGYTTLDHDAILFMQSRQPV